MEENPRFLPIVSTHRILFHFLILFHDFEGRKMKQNAVGTVYLTSKNLIKLGEIFINKTPSCVDVPRWLVSANHREGLPLLLLVNPLIGQNLTTRLLGTIGRRADISFNVWGNLIGENTKHKAIQIIPLWTKIKKNSMSEKFQVLPRKLPFMYNLVQLMINPNQRRIKENKKCQNLSKIRSEPSKCTWVPFLVMFLVDWLK